MELRWLDVRQPGATGPPIAILRIDPERWDLVVVARSQTGDPAGQTARGWARQHDLAVAVNAGMFAADHSLHLGYLEHRGQVLASGVAAYQSVAAFGPRRPTLPRFRIFDLDEPGLTIEAIRRDYASLVQNLRLIRRPGTNRWSQQDRRWSEAALGEDREGRILFVFSRAPFSMHDLDAQVLAAGIGVVALQHLEGGPEAQLYVHAGETEIELFGSFETGFREDDGNPAAWPIPNVLGVRRREAAPPP
jgi:uncharacterized protein YigE (DUF2233 family)